MFPSHFHSIFLTVVSLIMGGYISWHLAYSGSLGQAGLDGEPSNSVVATGPVLPSNSTLGFGSGASQKSELGGPVLQLPAALPRPERSPDIAEVVFENRKTRVKAEPRTFSGEYSPESVEYFTEIGFGVEYGVSAELLHKWTGDVLIRVYGMPTQDDMETLEQVVTEVNGLLSDINLQITEDSGNMSIYFLPESQFTSVEPDYVPVNLGFFRVWWDGTGAITRGRVLIASQGITQQERSHLVREELTQSLGLFKDSWRYPDSMFYQGWTDITRYSDLDSAAIRLLYNAQLLPGMTRDQALAALAALVADPSDWCCRD